MGVSLRAVVICAAVAVGLAAVVFWFYPRRPPEAAPPAVSDLPPDPRLTYAGPLKNVHPSVRYVGDERCAECHLDVTLPYSEHPMGRSLVPIRDLARHQPYDKAHNTPFDAKGVRLWAERDGDRARHRFARIDDGKPVWEAANEVHFAVGSGTRGYSYFTELDGYVYQTPISWYSQKGIWDLSPGFEAVSWPGRPVPTSCLQCHANHARQRPGYVDRFEPGVFAGHAIGCERCHGPGEVHAKAREGGGDPAGSIVNPSRLEWPLRENVCEQCHLGGLIRQTRRGRDWFDYRPGLPLSEFFYTFVVNPELPGSHLSVGQVEQMRRSKCFQKSGDKKKLGCVSCHDPHQRFEGADAVNHFRARCLTCHQDKGCSMPLEARRKQRPDDSCFACHMPRAQAGDIAHTALTDHTVPRVPGAAPAEKPVPNSPPFLPFYGVRADDVEGQRDLAVTLIRLATRGQLPPSMQRGAMGEMATPLQNRLRVAPTDPDGWQALGQARLLQRREAEALEAFRRARELQPLNERVLGMIADLEMGRGRADEAIPLWSRAAEIDPYHAAYRKALVTVLCRREDWAGAAPHAEAWVRLELNNADARQALTQVLLGQGKRDEARRAFDGLRALRPPNLAVLEAWYERLAR